VESQSRAGNDGSRREEEDARRGSGKGIDRLPVAGLEDVARSCYAQRSNSGVRSGKSQIPKHASTLITSWNSHLDCVVLGEEGGNKLAKKGRVEKRGHLSTATGPAQQPPTSSMRLSAGFVGSIMWGCS
jgi:hypothetical protein